MRWLSHLICMSLCLQSFFLCSLCFLSFSRLLPRHSSSHSHYDAAIPATCLYSQSLCASTETFQYVLCRPPLWPAWSCVMHHARKTTGLHAISFSLFVCFDLLLFCTVFVLLPAYTSLATFLHFLATLRLLLAFFPVRRSGERPTWFGLCPPSDLMPITSRLLSVVRY